MRPEESARLGAELDGEGGARFRVYAPKRTGVEVLLGDGAQGHAFPLAPGADGVWSGRVADVGAGVRYRYRLAGDDAPAADPVSRFQPDGVFGPSELIDPRFAWTDADYPGIPRRGRVAYELHVGTFTPEGTWEAARGKLGELARLGITVIEVMPVNEFFGDRGWGYDGVFWFAPHHHYGRPDDMRRFVDDAHRLGMGVILDVVYNHLGAVGNVLHRFAPDYRGGAATDWGDGMNFDTGDPPPARALVLQNVAYWIEEYHLDGFRFDATHSIVDRSPRHVVAEAAAAARERAGKKHIYLVGENEPQDTSLLRAPAPDREHDRLDALWNDDFHHTATVAATRHREGYFADYRGHARELLACARHGFLFQGQLYRWQNKGRGTSTRGLPHAAFVTFLENHDQIANFGLGFGKWTRTSPGRWRALTALLLLAPSTPMLFQGQEWGASARFAYFADLPPELVLPVKNGRAEFLQQFARYASPDARDRFPDPSAPGTFAAAKLDWRERDQPAPARLLAMHRDLLQLRLHDPTLSREGEDGVAVDGAALDDHVLALRYFADRTPGGADDRLLYVNLGADREPASIAEPLVAPPAGMAWRPLWSSDDGRYGGDGRRGPRPGHEVFLPGDAALLLVPGPREGA